MAQSMNLGNGVRPLSNVARLVTLVERVEKRAFGLPGMAVFHGFPGLGKTFASAFCAAQLDCIHISVQEEWTRKFLLKQILRELGLTARGQTADMGMQANEGLAIAGRTLIIDEADYALKKGMINLIRGLHDGSGVGVVLVGMEDLPQMLKSAEQVDGRILSWDQAEAADTRDTALLAEHYAPGVSFDEAMLDRIRKRNNGSARYISRDLAYVLEQCQIQGDFLMTADKWGDAPFPRAQAPVPRGALA